jgi:hypothetical protein
MIKKKKLQGYYLFGVISDLLEQILQPTELLLIPWSEKSVGAKKNLTET